MTFDLPARTAITSEKERVYRTALLPAHYLKLEQESLERGITPYRLTQIIMTKYVNGELKPAEKPDTPNTAAGA